MTEQLQQVAQTILQEPVALSVDIKAAGPVHALLQRWKWLPLKKTIMIYPITYGSMIKISKLLVQIDMSIYDLNNILDSNYKMIATHGEGIAKIVAYAIVNAEREPSGRLIKFILNNFTSTELIGTLAIVLKQMDIASFMKSIISMKGMNLLKMSPADQGSQIAPGQSLEAL